MIVSTFRLGNPLSISTKLTGRVEISSKAGMEYIHGVSNVLSVDISLSQWMPGRVVAVAQNRELLC